MRIAMPSADDQPCVLATRSPHRIDLEETVQQRPAPVWIAP
jgi:hypothetical protein